MFHVSRIKNKTNKIKFFSKHKQQKYDCETKVHLPHAKYIFFLHFFFYVHQSRQKLNNAKHAS